MAEPNCEWVSLTCASDRFDIDCGRVRCHYATADFAATTGVDVMVVVPAACCRASPMIAHAAVVASRGVGERCSVEIAVPRASARCARPYRFAYVDGRRYEVLGFSAPFVFDHCGGPCDCDSSAGGAGTADDDFRGWEVPGGLAAVRDISAFVSSLVDTRFSAPRCPACNVPTNHQQVLQHLTTSTDRLSRVALDIDRECAKQTERLNTCHSLLEHQQIKTNILNAEMEDGLRFADDLISSLSKNRKATFWTGNKMIFLKVQKTCEIEMSANQRFMYSIVNSQNQMIDNLTVKYKEILIMINTMQLFTKVL